jgi:protein involved in polysaccharide export with SLBB domain
MKTHVCFGALILTCALLAGCGGGGAYTPSNGGSAAVPSSDVIRVGDKITVQLSGTPDTGYFHEKQIPASGDITVDLLTQTFHAAGKTPAELAAEITDAYKSQKIYTNPVVNVIPGRAYYSRKAGHPGRL